MSSSTLVSNDQKTEQTQILFAFSPDEVEINQILQRIEHIEQSISSMIKEISTLSQEQQQKSMNVSPVVSQTTEQVFYYYEPKQHSKERKKKFFKMMTAALSKQLELNPSFNIKKCTKYLPKATPFEHMKHSFKL